MDTTERGSGKLFADPDPDAARAWFKTKSRRLESKVTTVREAVRELVADGAYLGIGGFGTNRIPTSLLHEIVRQGRRNLGVAGHTSTHDFQILAAGGCIDRCDVDRGRSLPLHHRAGVTIGVPIHNGVADCAEVLS